MFKDKVYLYKNINWKKEKVEKILVNKTNFNNYFERKFELKKNEKKFFWQIIF